MSWTAERIARLRLARTHGIGPLTLHTLLTTYETATNALENLPDRARRAGRDISLCDESRVKREIESTEDFGGNISFPGESDFPVLLGKLDPPPSVISWRGNIELANRSCVAMVGARNASAAAMRIAGDLARDLGLAGWVISSGLARGIDTACHKGSLDTGTIAVIAGGLDNIYPPQNAGLFEHIAETGLILTESPFGYDPRARDFPRRNRLITGLAYGVVVVEAAMKSGSLISARTALEQGREVMAVPGSPLDPRSKGSNGLIRNGATLVETAEHILDVLAPMEQSQSDLFRESEQSFHGDEAPAIDIELTSDAADTLLSLVSPVPVSLGDLARMADLPARDCASLLVELELAGKIRTLPGGMIKKAL